MSEALLGKGVSRRIAVPTDDRLAKRCPFLWELLTRDTYSDGTTRALPTVKIERVGGGFSVTLQDHASNMACEVIVHSLDNWERALEGRMSDLEHGWRPFTSWKVRDPSKRAKRKEA